jgi:predicted alpha/beta hydrolase
MNRTRHTLHAHDGQPLIAYCFEPAQTARASVVIAPGMAIAQSFYADFAHFLAGHGYRAWTFDYRGMGESRSGSLRGCEADISDWVKHDFDAMLGHAKAAGAALPLFILGHSLGGQTAPLLPSAAHISGLVNIAVGSGASHHNQPRTRRMAPLLWHVLMPLLSPLFGYFPGARIGVIGNVPRRAMEQWRRWCLNPEYLLSSEPGARSAYERAQFPVLGLTFSDDELLLEAGSKMMHEAYTDTPVDYRVLTPQQFGLPRIGHFGFFRKQHAAKLWPLVSDWLAKRSAGTTGVAATV